jgi:hypothetical protein
MRLRGARGYVLQGVLAADGYGPEFMNGNSEGAAPAWSFNNDGGKVTFGGMPPDTNTHTHTHTHTHLPHAPLESESKHMAQNASVQLAANTRAYARARRGLIMARGCGGCGDR